MRVLSIWLLALLFWVCRSQGDINLEEEELFNELEDESIPTQLLVISDANAPLNLLEDDLDISIENLNNLIKDKKRIQAQMDFIFLSINSSTVNLDNAIKELSIEKITKRVVQNANIKLENVSKTQRNNTIHIKKIFSIFDSLLDNIDVTRIELSKTKDDLEKKGPEIEDALRQVEVKKEIDEIVNGEIDYDTGQLRLKNGSLMLMDIDDAYKIIGEGSENISDPALMQRDFELFYSFILLLVATTIGGFLAVNFGIPQNLGYLIGGIIVGPNCLGLVNHLSQLETLAQIGTVFMLFQHGIEYPIDHRAFTRTHVLSALFIMLLQLVFCCATGLVNGVVPNFTQGIVYGVAISISSSVQVIEYLRKSRQSETTAAKYLATILAIQDLFLTIMISLPEIVRSLQDGSVLTAIYKFSTILFSFFVLGVVASFLSQKVIPKIMDRLALDTTISRESELLAVVCLCLFTSLVTDLMQLSLEGGAFVAGLMITSKKHRQTALDKVQPLTGVFGGMFYASIGLILSPAFLWKEMTIIFIISLQSFIVKVMITGVFLVCSMVSARNSLLLAIPMSNVSEFAFVFLSKVQAYKLLDRKLYLIMLGSVVLNSVVAPVFVRFLPSIKMLYNPYLENFEVSFNRGVIKNLKEDDEIIPSHHHSPM